MTVVVVVLVVLVVAWLVTAPLRPGAAERELAAVGSERAELEALKEAKYREIRDAELDYRTGKLSEADYKSVDRGLRAEAIDILDRLDSLA